MFRPPPINVYALTKQRAKYLSTARNVNTIAPSKQNDAGKEDNSVPQSILSEMRTMFQTFATEQDRKLSGLEDVIKEIRTQNSEIIKNIEYLSQEYDEIKNRLSKYEAEGKEHLSYVCKLGNKIEDLERKILSSCVELRNIPKTKANEFKEELTDIVLNLCSKLSLNLQRSDIKDNYRPFLKSEVSQPADCCGICKCSY